jgi:hypothetical protein
MNNLQHIAALQLYRYCYSIPNAWGYLLPKSTAAYNPFLAKNKNPLYRITQSECVEKQHFIINKTK